MKFDVGTLPPWIFHNQQETCLRTMKNMKNMKNIDDPKGCDGNTSIDTSSPKVSQTYKRGYEASSLRSRTATEPHSIRPPIFRQASVFICPSLNQCTASRPSSTANRFRRVQFLRTFQMGCG